MFLKLTVLKLLGVTMKAERTEVDITATLDVLVDHIWRTIIRHSKKHHRLVLMVDDEDQTLWCHSCRSPVAGGTDEVMRRCGERMKKNGIRFEVDLFTLLNNH